jgi:hypothetical protein
MILKKLKTAGRNAFERLVEAREREAARQIKALHSSRREF